MRILEENDKLVFGATEIGDGDFAAPTAKDVADDAKVGVQYESRVLIHALKNDPYMPQDMVVARLVHGVGIVRVTDQTPIFVEQTDGLVTSRKNVLLCVAGADCPPVLIADEKHGVIGLAHSGRKGTEGNIAGRLMSEVMMTAGTAPEGLKAWVGPGICLEHYEVGPEIAKPFVDFAPDGFVEIDGKTYLGLPQIIRKQLLREHLVNKAITVLPECTYEQPERWWSHRRAMHAGVKRDRPQVQLFFAYLK